MAEGNIAVIDLGSYSTKIGWSGFQAPKSIIPTMIGKPLYPSTLSGFSEINSSKTYIGEDLLESLPFTKTDYFIKEWGESYSINWESLETFYSHILNNELKIEDLKTASIVNTLLPYFNQKDQERFGEILFEKFSILEFTFLDESVCMQFAARGLNGLLVNIGHLSTRIYPFYEGNLMRETFSSMPIGSHHLTLSLGQQLMEEGIVLETNDQMEVLSELKHSCCCVNPFVGGPDLTTIKKKFADRINNTPKLSKENSNQDLDLDLDLDLENENVSQPSIEEQIFDSFLQFGGFDPIDCEISDGKKFLLGDPRHKLAECLFKPTVIGINDYGLHQKIAQTIMKCPIDTRRKILNRVFFVGSGAEIPFLEDRLIDEIEGIKGIESNVALGESQNAQDKKCFAWIGASILGVVCEKMSTLLIDKDDYLEAGKGIISEKVIKKMQF
ncbi:actin-5c-related [Anaeramoeba flamelloides]|uniref:Actin-5c-related n=1 Tax=Anaeramoeba flamelloides TaxID=1746091 RepID=A0AAV7ZXU7_9EUKA|nr:actin-5c-related [Anaeramoeba flamelloides]